LDVAPQKIAEIRGRIGGLWLASRMGIIVTKLNQDEIRLRVERFCQLPSSTKLLELHPLLARLSTRTASRQ
jgi:hypothetical protein